MSCDHFLFPQEGDWAFPAPAEARVLCETGHEGHPHRPAHDLHTSHRLYGQLHEKVSCLSRSRIPLPHSYTFPSLYHFQRVSFPTLSRPVSSRWAAQEYLVSLISSLSSSLQHPALRRHCVHVPVPGRRQVHVPLPRSAKGGHEQQWGQERDLGGAVCNTNRGT